MGRGTSVALVAAMVVISGCTAGQAPAGTLAWGSCVAFGQQAAPGVECAWLTVPLDPAHPDDGAARIGVLRHRATGDRVGTLVWNPGGGLEHGMAAARDLAASGGELTERFDVVGFDRRGLGASTPTAHCYSTEDWVADRARPAGATARDHAYQAACARHTGVPVLSTLGTDAVAGDLEALRIALGEERISYYGASSGTRLGIAYAERFGGSLRTLVLDSTVATRPVDPVTGSADPVPGATALGRSLERGYRAFAATCRGCPPLRQVLRKAPVPVGERALSYTDAWAAVRFGVLDPRRFGALRTGLGELAQGRGDALLRMADTAYGAGADGGMPGDYDIATALTCADSPRYSAAEITAADRAYLAAAPSLADGLGGPHVLGVCADWPGRPGFVAHVPSAPGLRTGLVVADTQDRLTPYADSTAVARALRLPVLTRESDRHVGYRSGSSCVDSAVTAYLVDGSARPLRCGG